VGAVLADGARDVAGWVGVIANGITVGITISKNSRHQLLTSD
jgi:hypothetical protein